ncbi:MAG: hypothetical protein VB031_02265 [Eubacteriaceae bacterium]|nr:hypothetical protein [Eubacteriaceae bacterium]
MARRRKLTDKLQKDMCAYIASGLTKKGACDAVCIDESTFYKWMSEGQEDINAEKTTDASEFFKSIKEAEAKFKLTHIRNIKNVADEGTWAASAWLLERCYRNEYGRNTMDARVELTGKDDGPIKTESTVQVYIPDNGREKKKKTKAKK